MEYQIDPLEFWQALAASRGVDEKQLVLFKAKLEVAAAERVRDAALAALAAKYGFRLDGPIELRESSTTLLAEQLEALCLKP